MGKLHVLPKSGHLGYGKNKTSRLAGSLDFRPFFSQGNCQKYLILGLKWLNLHLHGMIAAVVVSDLFPKSF